MDGPRSLAEYLDDFRDVCLPIAPANARSVGTERRAIDDYLELWPSEWREHVESLADSLSTMPDDVRVVALAPARMEQTRITGLLDGLSQDIAGVQDFGARMLELIILENWLTTESRDDTEAAVTYWTQHHPRAYAVHLCRHQFAASATCRLALARKLLADVALLRSRRRPIQSAPLYLLSEDADVTQVERGRTLSAVRILDARPWLDGLRGPQERSLSALRSNDLLLLERRSWQFTELLLSSSSLHPHIWPKANFYWNRVVTAGSNVMFSAEAYALIRGYSTGVPLFEDMDIGQRLSVLRGEYFRGRFVPNVRTVQRFSSREESDAARVMLSLRTQTHLYDDGDPDATFYNSQHEYAVRNADKRALLEALSDVAFLSRGNSPRFEAILTSLLRETYRILCDEDSARKVFNRVMHWLGFAPDDFRCSGHVVSLHRFSGFCHNASSFRHSLSRLEHRNRLISK